MSTFTETKVGKEPEKTAEHLRPRTDPYGLAKVECKLSGGQRVIQGDLLHLQ